MVTGDPSDLVKWVINLGAFGLVSWLVRHTFRHTIPRLANDFRETLQQERKIFLEELRSQRVDFKEELKYERGLWAERIDSLTESVSRLEETLRDYMHNRKGPKNGG